MSDPVVDLGEIHPRVALITMQDRIHKNGFSPELVAGLIDAFKEVECSDAFRAVVLTGYDTYFSSGGTKEGLLAIQERRSRFTDVNLYGLALNCRLPVVAAMQGHGIGGGLALGLYADFVVMSRESVYAANFMRYGFTPGMGATLILPKKLGFALGTEMLATGARYRGAELAARGVPFPVLPRREVLPTAAALARDLAEKPATSMQALKAHFVRPILQELPTVIEQELAMHAITFHSDDVKRRVVELFEDRE